MSDKPVYEGQIREQIARQSGDSKTLLRQFSGELFDSIPQVLEQRGHLRLHAFGSFKLKWTRERRGRNPGTGEVITIPAQPRVVFTPAKALRDRVNARQPSTAKAVTPDPVAAAGLRHSQIPQAAELLKQDADINPAALQNDPAPEKKTGFQQQALVAALALLGLGLVYYYNSDTGTSSPPRQSVAVQTTQPAGSDTPGPEPKPAATVPVEDNVTHQAVTMKTTTRVAQSPAGDEHPTSREPWFKQRPHKLRNGDSLWRLSAKNYTNPFYWPHIYQANRYDIRNPNKLIMGKTISLPTLQGRPGELSADDRRQIAEGYFLVYRYYRKHNKPYPYYALLGVNKFDPAVIQEHIYEIDDRDWENFQLASN